MPRMTRVNLDSRGPWEPVIGYARAVKVDSHIYVSGTTATDANGGVVGIGEPYTQAVFIIRKIATALHLLGADLSDVVRTRIFLTDLDSWPVVARAHREAFAGILPANSLLVVSALVSPDLLVEIEADAEIAAGATGATTIVDNLAG